MLWRSFWISRKKAGRDTCGCVFLCRFSKVQISIPKFPGMASSAPASILYFLAILCSILFPSLVGIGHAARFASTSCYDKSGCPNYQAPIAAKDGGISISGNQYSHPPPPQVRDEERNSVANYSKQGLACPPQRSGRGNSPSPGSKSASLPACRQPPCTLDNQEKIRGEGSNSVASNKQGIVCDPHRSNRGNFPSPSKCGPPASEEKNSALKTDWRANAKQENMDDGGGGLNQSQRHQAPWKKGKTITP